MYSSQEKGTNKEDTDNSAPRNPDLFSQDENVVEQQEERHKATLREGMSRGVTRIEAVRLTMNNEKHSKLVLYLFGLSILICAWAYSLGQSTTSNYDPYAASSFGKHSMLSTVAIATKIISAVSRPFLAKIADVSSRPATYVLVVCFYTVGYIIAAGCQTISAFVVGQVFVSIGSAGIDLMNSIIVGDLTPLKWRGLMNSILATPFIINVWFSGLIVQDLLDTNWRWGYGMFAIMLPVVLAPAVFIMFWLQRRAEKLHILEDKTAADRPPLTRRIWDLIIEVDAPGLILLGFGWSLLLLPFSLYPFADKQWKNPSMIAMVVVGGVFLICFVFYEVYVAPFPCTPRRVVFNRTFIMSVIIDFIYLLAGQLGSLYFSSYVWIVKDWSAQDWTYYNNTLTLSLCVFGVVAGIIMRTTHRYKYMQVFGLFVKIVGMGVIIDTNGYSRNNTQALVWHQILIGFGGGFSVVGSQIAAQASVPHQDLAIVISLLSLWSNIGSAIGSAIAGPVWTSKMPKLLRKYLPDSVSEEDIQKFFGNIKAIRSYDYHSDIRQGAIRAYSKTMWYLFVSAISICFIPLICACLQTNYFLGNTQNAVDDTVLIPESDDEKEKENEHDANTNLTWKDKLANFFNRPLAG